MKPYYYSFLVSGFLLFSCGTETTNDDLPEFPVDKEESAPLLLSEIAESISAIELELTDESPINPMPFNIKRILVSDDMLFIAQQDNILIFNRNGKFVRSIGSKGQGPGEYTRIRNLALDEKNRRLFVNANQKIICYDFDGKVLMESSSFQLNGIESIIDINYISSELLIIGQSTGTVDRDAFIHTTLYRLNDKLQIIDSCIVQQIHVDRPSFSFKFGEDYILCSNSTIYLFYPSQAVAPLPNRLPSKIVLRDTLYRLKNNHLIPELKLKFKDDGIDGAGYVCVNMYNAYRSSRYIFAQYDNYSLDHDMYYPYFCFCYDTKTGTGYNMRDGYTDDIHQIEKVRIRPFHTNPDMFYYWHTHLKPNDLEEPNPTLYIGTLKK